MAKKKSVVIPDDIQDYYFIYSLNKSAKTKDIRKELMIKHGEIRSNMSSGSLNSEAILAKFQESDRMITSAIKVFRNDERRKEYDLALQAAYETGKLHTEVQEKAKSIYEELEAMFSRGNYRGVIQRCMEVLDAGLNAYGVYNFLARAYFAMKEIDKSLQAVDDGLIANPDNIPLLKVGARYSNQGKNDFEKSQGYINRMLEIDPESSEANAEQCYLYMCTGKKELAYQRIDEYMEKHPNDMKFRKNCAYDLIGRSFAECYITDKKSGAHIIATEEEYNKALEYCNKAASLYDDKSTYAAKKNAEYFGETVYNEENKENIKWVILSGVIYLFLSVASIIGLVSSFGALDAKSKKWSIIGTFVLVILTITSFHNAFMLNKVSYRPYWQIYKYILTGRREKKEQIYVSYGEAVSSGIKIGWKTGIEVFKMIGKIILGGF